MTRRLVLTYLAVTALVLVVLGVPLGVTLQNRERARLQAEMSQDAFVVASYTVDVFDGGTSPDVAAVKAVIRSYAERTGARVVAVDAGGTPLVDTDPAVEPSREFATRPEFQQALAGKVSSGVRYSATLQRHLMYVAVPVATSGRIVGAVRVSLSTSSVDRRVRAQFGTLAGFAALAVGLAAGLGVVLARSVTRPLRRLEGAATALGGGDLRARVPVSEGPPEVRRLGAAFNDTASRLEDLVRAQDAFVADASHQLRSPLTALRLRLEMLEADAPEGFREDVHDALAETTRLSRIVDGLLQLARVDVDRGPRSVVDLAVVVQERHAVWEPLAAERQVVLIVEDGPGAPVRADADRVAQVLDNLVANAVDAAPAGTRVVLATVRTGDDAEAHVRDEGPGMTDEQRARAFDRFWRATSTRTALSGSGLGLPIADKLARADGGRIELRPNAPGGLDAVACYPLARA